jgi:hypothetical protein
VLNQDACGCTGKQKEITGYSLMLNRVQTVFKLKYINKKDASLAETDSPKENILYFIASITKLK